MHEILKEFIDNSYHEIKALMKCENEIFAKSGGFTSAGANNLHLLLENRKHAMKMLEVEYVESEGPEAHAHDELKGAQEYYDMWIDTGNSVYKTMAADELRHAELFTNQISDPALKVGLERKRDMLLAKLV